LKRHVDVRDGLLPAVAGTGGKRTLPDLAVGLLGYVEFDMAKPWYRDSIAFAALLSIALGSAGCSVKPTAPDHVGIARGYDSAAKTLTINCDVATRGSCSVLLDDKGVQRTLNIGLGKHVTLADVSADAKTCAISPGTSMVQCTWVPVTPRAT
jgi:hypothetical protein